jgi:hypothetical protein
MVGWIMRWMECCGYWGLGLCTVAIAAACWMTGRYFWWFYDGFEYLVILFWLGLERLGDWYEVLIVWGYYWVLQCTWWLAVRGVTGWWPPDSMCSKRLFTSKNISFIYFSSTLIFVGISCCMESTASLEVLNCGFSWWKQCDTLLRYQMLRA